MPSARRTRRSNCLPATKAAITTARSTTRASARLTCGTGSNGVFSPGASAHTSLRDVNIVVFDDLSPAGGFALHHGIGRSQRALVLGKRRDAFVRPGLDDRR